MPVGSPYGFSHQAADYTIKWNDFAFNSQTVDTSYPYYVPAFPQVVTKEPEPEPTVLDWLHDQVEEICEFARAA